ncbi:hypothetical protein Kpol_541p9 [Vanderwaltozyma polyspora DSM 70294]|uniref:Ceramide very long chain fatty acid hydroxylase n=1 Tax=Vanderwaltozyma polyspora (strain ATCC 22028 / DSM 70294 / BCRC 21397 / CBS 2163 / NBRC 10782 / NRRL Y-8283 / UCD 57-17) TaxID=436907 RepID=A7TIV4_VANPO|nr:uncharacterized protein Kpol_541p9 [Vanderwaltozyma polyspora DSM 70294]EDO17766.1 hypothetical protein Kpol_541p9 [Vanderwaltozyma polyspora DSM 70294]
MSAKDSKTLELFAKSRFEEHNTEADCWVSVKERLIYDVSSYLKDNADADSSILEHAGKDITKLTKTREFKFISDEYLVGYLATEEEEVRLLTNKDHKVEVNLQDGTYDSTVFVKELPAEEKFTVATDLGKDFQDHHFLDLNKPMLWQVLFGNFTRDFYIDQVHRPRHYGKGSAPLFGNFLEPISLTPWWLIPIIWGPVVVYHLSVALNNMNNIFAGFLFCLGIFVWTLIEYCLHRFLFHLDDWVPQHNIFYTLHFLLHGVHHYLPMDQYRLVVPPALFLVLCTPIYKLVFGLLPLYWAYAGFAGGLLGYICYDLTHYFIHHVKLPKFMRKVKKHHLEHHYKNYQLGFGVSNYFWDKVFGTYLGPDSPASIMRYK